jgi:hypothetical protein
MRPCQAQKLEYRLLGGFELRGDGVPVAADAWQRPMAARVVRFLLVHRDAVPEDRLLETFWRDRDPAAARRCLAVSLSRCRTVLRPDAIASRDRAHRLVVGACDTVDADAFEHAAALAIGKPPGRERVAELEGPVRRLVTRVARQALRPPPRAARRARRRARRCRRARRRRSRGAPHARGRSSRRGSAPARHGRVRGARQAEPGARPVPPLPADPRGRARHRAGARDRCAARSDPRR